MENGAKVARGHSTAATDFLTWMFGDVFTGEAVGDWTFFFAAGETPPRTFAENNASARFVSTDTF